MQRPDRWRGGRRSAVGRYAAREQRYQSAINLIPCGQGHSAQLLAIGSGRDRSLVSRDDLEAACRAVATVVMRTERPVRAGELITVIDVTDDGKTTPDAPLTVGCFSAAAGQRQLNGSVIGLGDRPVPFAN